MQSWTSSIVGGQLRTRAERYKKSDQGWIGGARQLCLNSKEAGSALLSGLLPGIILLERMRGVLVLDTSRMISVETVEMRTHMPGTWSEQEEAPGCLLHEEFR